MQPCNQIFSRNTHLRCSLPALAMLPVPSHFLRCLHSIPCEQEDNICLCATLLFTVCEVFAFHGLFSVPFHTFMKCFKIGLVFPVIIWIYLLFYSTCDFICIVRLVVSSSSHRSQVESEEYFQMNFVLFVLYNGIICNIVCYRYSVLRQLVFP